MNKKVALISSYCDDEEKIGILRENIQKLKDNGLDIILMSPLMLPESIVSACDYFFYTKDNDVLLWPIDVQMYWAYWELNGENYLLLKQSSRDYGWPGLTHVKKLTEIALTFDYDYFYHLIYDLIIDENVINGLKNPADCCVYSTIRGESIWPSALHFMIFNRENVKKLSEAINFKNYLKFLNSDMKTGKDALGFLHSLKDTIGFENPKIPVEDKIFINRYFFNHCRVLGSEFFLEKNTLDLKENLKILFFAEEEIVNFNVSINGLKKSAQVKRLSIYDLGVTPLDFEYGFIEHKNKVIDLEPIFKSIKYSCISFGKLPN